MVDKVYEANQFRNMILALDHQKLSEEAEQALYIYLCQNKQIRASDLKKELIWKNLKTDFALSITFLEDRTMIVLEDYPSDKWREICAKEARDREIFFFGDSNIDIDTWVPEGWNF